MISLFFNMTANPQDATCWCEKKDYKYWLISMLSPEALKLQDCIYWFCIKSIWCADDIYSPESRFFSCEVRIPRNWVYKSSSSVLICFYIHTYVSLDSVKWLATGRIIWVWFPLRGGVYLGPTNAAIKWVLGLFLGNKVHTDLHLVPILRKCGVVPLLLHAFFLHYLDTGTYQYFTCSVYFIIVCVLRSVCGPSHQEVLEVVELVIY
jgi:hypothetical protein